MPIKREPYYVCKCDNCGRFLSDKGHPFETFKDAFRAAVEHGWDVSTDRVQVDAALCPDCSEGVE